MKATPEKCQSDARDIFNSKCGTCHGDDGDGQSRVGHNLYPRATGPALGAHAEPHRRRAALHHRERRAIHRHARVGHAASGSEADRWETRRDISASLKPYERSTRTKTLTECPEAGHYMRLASRASSATRIFMIVGRKRRWPTSCATHGSIRRHYSDLSTNTVAKFTGGQSRWCMGAFGSSATLRKSATTISA